MSQGAEHVFFHKKQTHKQFYQRFQLEYLSFRQAIQGIPLESERQAYARLLLRRLMVLYFLQNKGLLDHDKNYLPNRLQSMQKEQGRFYRSFLIPLFHNFLYKFTALSDATPFIGHIPALALPLFQVHPLEQNILQIQIPDAAFIRLFTFFAEYQWNLEDQAQGRMPDALYPEILSTIFEQQINQKQMGAYYTKNDVTTYIATNTVLPYLLHTLETLYPEEFRPGSTLMCLLQNRPERYISTALQQKQYLPEETQREYGERRTRYQHLYTHLQTGQLHTIDDLITFNLTIARFVQDGIASCEKPEILLAFYRGMEQMSILDPTCGSGAFLCAVVNTLEPLYTNCLKRLQSITDNNAHRLPSNTPKHIYFDKEGLDGYRALLDKMEAYPTRKHFILDTILSHNLYGVDIMEEATDLCKLRLFLSLVACSTRIEDVQSFSSIQWHIVTGNAVVGSVHSLNQHINPPLPSTNSPTVRATFTAPTASSAPITTHTSDQDQKNTHFHWSEIFPQIMKRGGFDVIIGNPPYVEYSKVRQNYRIQGDETNNYGNLYAAVLERSLTLCRPGKSYLGLVVPLSVCGGERFAQLRSTMTDQLAKLWLANFEIFPSRLFDGAFQRLSIVIARHANNETHTICTTRIQRWYAAERLHLIDVMYYVPAQRTIKTDAFPKLASPLQEMILHKLSEKAQGGSIASILITRKTTHFVYYQEATNYWMKATCRVPYYKKNGEIMEPTHGRFLYFENELTARVVMALMNSSLFYLWFATFSDGFHLSHKLVKGFPLPLFPPSHTPSEPSTVGTTFTTSNDSSLPLHQDWIRPTFLEQMEQLALRLEADIRIHAKTSTRNTRTHLIELEEYRMSASKGLLDEIDVVLGKYYELSDEEVKFTMEYDEKYRMGKERGNGHIE